MKNPSKVPFKQAETKMTGSSTKKNPSKLGFKQPMTAAGKTSAKKSPGKLGFTQKSAAMKGSSTKKNPGKADFKQPAHGKSPAMPAYAAKKVAPAMGKQKGNPKVTTSFKSLDDVTKYRRKKYGV